MNNGKVLVGFALGALAGTALSCLAQSHHGHHLKKKIYQVIQDMKAKGCGCKACECGDECTCEKTVEETAKT